MNKQKRMIINDRRIDLIKVLAVSQRFCGQLSGLLFVFCLSLTISAQRIGVLTPDQTTNSTIVKENVEKLLSKNFKILDDSLIETAFQNLAGKNLFNLSTEEAQNSGIAAGCDFFIVLKSATLRRASLSKLDYYEAYAAIYLVSTRTGRLVLWKLSSFEDQTTGGAEKKLIDFLPKIGSEISANLKSAQARELNEPALPKLEELPDENSPEAKNFRSPLPYKRMRPGYTAQANFYSIEATIDALVDVDEVGKIARIEITRWAGYGLDEAVTEIIKKMQWRPAERDGKTLPIRVLLRYNFKKLENQD